MTESELQLQQQSINQLYTNLGFEVCPCYFEDIADSFIVGYCVTLRHCKIIYRLEAQNSLMIVKYWRYKPAKGIRNAFADLLFFLDTLYSNNDYAEHVLGVIEQQPSQFTRRLSAERIALFYKRYLCVHEMESNEGLDWVGEVPDPLGSRWIVGRLSDYAKKRKLVKTITTTNSV